MDCTGLDAGCFVGACDPQTAACKLLSVQDGSPCDDLDACTGSDACYRGVCGGVPKNRSTQDSPCGVGACDALCGLCAVSQRPDGTPCDDRDFCTSGDACVSGTCVGAISLCGACADKLVSGCPCKYSMTM